MSLMQKYAHAAMDARALAQAAARIEPRYLAIPEDELTAFIEELRTASGNPLCGFDRNSIRREIESGRFIIFGLVIIIRERVVC